MHEKKRHAASPLWRFEKICELRDGCRTTGLALYLLSKVVGAVQRPLIELGDARTLIGMISSIESQGAETRGLRDNRGHGVSICGVHE